MRKIPTLFVRDPDNMKLVTDKVAPGLEWVLNGRCIAREKLDGTACAILHGRLYERFTAKALLWPDEFIPSGGTDGTSKQPGWVPVDHGPDDKWHREAWDSSAAGGQIKDGTYELVGPKVQGNPYGYANHHLLRHDDTDIFHVDDLSFAGFKAFFSEAVSSPDGPRFNIEGLVFWGPEGPVCKIKRRDFGLPWPVKEKT